MSATYRIEMFSPRKPVKDKYPVRVEPVIARYTGIPLLEEETSDTTSDPDLLGRCRTS